MQSSLKTKCHQSFLSTKVNSFIVLQHATNPYIHPGHHFPPFVLHTSYPDITFSVVKTPQDKPTYLPWTPFPPYMTNQTSDPGHHFFCSEDPPRQTHISTLDTISTIPLTPPRTNQTSYPGHHFFCGEDPPRQTYISTISTIRLTPPQDKSNILPWTSLFL